MQLQINSNESLRAALLRAGVPPEQVRAAQAEVRELNDLSPRGRVAAGTLITIPDTFIRTARPAGGDIRGPSVRSPAPAAPASASDLASSDATETSTSIRSRWPRRRASATGFSRPAGRPLELTEAMKAVVGGVNESLNLRVLNDSFNPYIEQFGRFKHPDELFQGKALLDVQKIVGGLVQSAPEAARPVLAPLVPLIRSDVVLRTAAQQFVIDDRGVPGNRIIFYGGSVGHEHIDQLVQELGKQHIRLIKQMGHFDGRAQGGTPEAILGDGVAGITHAGGFSAGYLKGKPTSIRSDWPADYGILDEDNIDYNAHLYAIDYAAGAKKPIPEKTVAAYKSNADMWDAVAGMIVPFTGSELDTRYRNYMYNPLEVHSQASAQAVARSLAHLDTKTFLKEHGAFYCAEGQYSVANLGPNALIKKSLYQDTPLGKLIETFQQAPGLTRKRPEIGWAYLRDQGLITDDQFSDLADTHRLATYLEWVPEDVQPWTAYEPYNAEGLIAKPMTVATLAWGLLHSYLPREGVADAVADEVTRVYRDAVEHNDVAVQTAATALCGGLDPTSYAGKKALHGVALRAASGFLLSILGNPDFKNKILTQAGFNEITNDEDKARVVALYDKFVSTLKDPRLDTQEALDAAIRAVDDECGALEVERQTLNPVDGSYLPARRSLMLYAAPQCYAFWAQQPEVFGDSPALRYVATAMHAQQAKRGILPLPAEDVSEPN
ncbi:MAG: hypothetical protein IPK13_07440 [Deltaproteobacteria bacterium]|nr:hypothetical protein [Deltaproteobacteria bacterium]